MTEGEMAGWHHRLNGHEFAPSPGDSEAQCSLVGHRPCGHEESSHLLQKDLRARCESWIIKMAELRRIDDLSFGAGEDS